MRNMADIKSGASDTIEIQIKFIDYVPEPIEELKGE